MPSSRLASSSRPWSTVFRFRTCPRGPRARALDQRQQTGMVAAVHLVARNPIAIGTVHRHHPSPSAQFERNENRAIIGIDGRAYVGCLHLTSPRVRVLGNPNLSEARPMVSTVPALRCLRARLRRRAVMKNCNQLISIKRISAPRANILSFDVEGYRMNPPKNVPR
jgi:hypothetical protein